MPAIFYSFSFCPNPEWTSLYPSGPEIVRYLQSVCEKYEITDKVQNNTDVLGCKWLEDEQLWEVKLQHLVPGTGDLSEKDRQKIVDEQGEAAVYTGVETIRAKVVATAVGGLVEPKDVPPEIPGWDKFKGEVFHSARWRDDIDFTDKNVVVLGTGCSAAQLTPRMTQAPYNAKKVTQLMRSPPWVCPKIAPPGGAQNFGVWAPKIFKNVPGALRLVRTIMFWGGEADWALFGNEESNKKYRAKTEQRLLKHMRKQAPEKYYDILTPNYGVGCKRRIFDYEWLRSLNDPKIELSTLPLTEVKEDTVVLGPGRCYPDPKNIESPVPTAEREIPADVIIMANGFNTRRWFHPLAVTGRDGKDLLEVMEERGGPQAYLGNAMDGFPNYFIIFGPNTATGHSSVILASENMVQYSLRMMAPILRGEVATVEVKREAEERYTRDIQARLKDTVWHSGGCHSWYFREDGWNSTVLPYSQVWATWQYRFPRWSDWNFVYTAKGRRRLLVSRLLRLAIVATATMGAFRLYNEGNLSIGGLKRAGMDTLAMVIDNVQGGLTAAKNALRG